MYYVSGIGVPILLGYVYGVVPISLCRSGGCGITKCIVCVSGIGVPILLGYVYGVVPISLCRSGGCGITTDGGGVRFEFEENETGIPSGMYPCK